MTPEEWAQVHVALSGTFGQVKLDCDGYKVTLLRGIVGKNRLGVSVYVNGWMKGKWLTKDCEERRRFYWPRKRFVHRGRFRQRIKKVPKKLRKELGIDPDKTIVTYWPHWHSFLSLKRHLIENNESITLLEVC